MIYMWFLCLIYICACQGTEGSAAVCDRRRVAQKKEQKLNLAATKVQRTCNCFHVFHVCFQCLSQNAWQHVNVFRMW